MPELKDICVSCDEKILELKNICFSYGKKAVLSDFSMQLANGEILAVMGPSGCGKTTLLRLVAGLEKPKSGTIVSQAQSITYVFQEPRLFPWLTVRQNLRAILSDPKESDERLLQVLERVGLGGCAALYPDELSGGMKSRASLARALLHGGDLYLLDEPFAALDEELRASLSSILRQHIKDSGASAILVTHQLSDADMIADRVLKI